MSHNHSHGQNHGDSTKNILIAFALNFSFAIFEIIGGIITGSTAILSDAVHDFGDSLSLGLSLIFQKFSLKKATEKYSFGFRRLSLIGAIINILVLLGGTIYVLTEAVDRFSNPRTVMAEGMLFMAIIGILVNGFSVFRMKGSKKILDKTVMMHLLEDLLGWIAVFVVSIVMYFTKLYVLDPILSLIICVIILKNIFENTKSAIDMIMNATPDIELYRHISDHIKEMTGVTDIKRLNMWTQDGEEHMIAAQINVDASASDTLLADIKSMLSEEGISHSTIEIVRV